MHLGVVYRSYNNKNYDFYINIYQLRQIVLYVAEILARSNSIIITDFSCDFRFLGTHRVY